MQRRLFIQYRICPYGPSWTVAGVQEYTDDRSRQALVYSAPGGYLNTNSDGNLDLAATYNDIYPKVTA